MRKFTTILLFYILLFNLIGYRICTYYMKYKVEAMLDKQLGSDNYDHSQLVSIKMPAPDSQEYAPDGQYEKISGSIEIGGIQYRYIKRRFSNDSLEYICIRDNAAMKLRAKTRALFARFKDLQHGNKSEHHSVSFRFLFIDYYNAEDFLDKNNSYLSISRLIPDSENTPSPYAATEKHPPRQSC